MSTFAEACGQFEAEARRAGWQTTTREDGAVVWCTFHPPEAREAPPHQGWKLHVSFAETESAQVFDTLLPALMPLGVPFKIAATEDSVAALNDGRAGDSQQGKNLTLYPADAERFRSAALAVLAVWSHRRGPAVSGDLPLCERGNVGMRYGAFAGDVSLVDAVGRVRSALITPDGQLVADDRKSAVPPSWAPPPPLPPLAKPDPTAPFAVASGWVPVALLQSGAKGEVRMAMRTQAPFELAIVKSARRGVPTTTNGHDAVDLLRREHAVQGQLFELGFPCARPLEFAEGPDAALAVSLDLGGDPLASLRPPEARRHMPGVLRLVARLHRLGYVHRDLKPQNILVTTEGLALIDFELACAVDDSDAPGAKTDGYCATDPTDRSLRRDYAALAATLAWAWLGAHPTGSMAAPSARFAALELHGMHHVAGWIRRLGEADAFDLEGLATELEASLDAPCPLLRVPPRLSLQHLGRGAVHHLARFEQVGNTPDEVCWRNARNEGDSLSEGLYRGTAGVTLGLMTLEELSGERADERVAAACTWLVNRPLHEASAGLFTGNAGVALALAVAARRYARRDWVTAADRYFDAALAAPLREADLYFGASGVLWCATLLDQALGTPHHALRARPIADWLQATLCTDQAVWYWPNNGTLNGGGPPYLGAAHGAAGTAMALKAWAAAMGEAAPARLAEEVLVRLFEHTKTRDGHQLAANLGAQDEANPAHVWCHGVGGYLWALLQGGGPTERLRPALDWCLKRVLQTPAVGNPTYCHGLAGRLEVLRMAAPHGDVAAARAATVAALEQQALEDSGAVVWPCEDGSLVSPELWTGFLAPMTALALDGADLQGALLSAQWLRRLAGGVP